LGLNQYEITAIVALKPMSAILAPYWSQVIYQRPDRVVANLLWSHILRYLPFLFLPLVGGSSWFMIAAFGMYMLLCRGAIPGWMEACKRNLSLHDQGRIVGYGSIIDYCAAAIVPFVIGPLMDGYEQAWRWVIPLTAAIGLVSAFFLYRIPQLTGEGRILQEPCCDRAAPFKEHLIKPWKQAWQLIRENKSFASFQMGFMLGGAGLMVMQPALPSFFVDVLHLSYTKMLVAMAVCKGVGVAVSSPFWTKLFRRLDIHYFSGIVTILAALFPFLLLSAQLHVISVYIAFGLYGIMQGGSELSWNMSGPAFAKEKDSSAFSGTNVLMVGIRGCFVPFLGAILFTATNSAVTMLLGSFLCILATAHLFKCSSVQKTVKSQS
jgi:hypothetical protein